MSLNARHFFAGLCHVILIVAALPTSAQVQEVWRVVLTNASFEDFQAEASGAVVLAFPTRPETNAIEVNSAAGITRIGTQGNRLWTTILPDLNVGSRERGFLASDHQGNTFIAGRSNYLSPCRLHMLDFNGQSLWQVNENLEDNTPVHLATSSAGVLMAATAFRARSSNGFWFAHYDTAGNTRWKTNIVRPATQPGAIVKLVGDPVGNWLALGWAYVNGGNRADILTKLSPGGTLLWTRESIGDVTGDNGIQDFHLAPDGSVLLSVGAGLRKLAASGETIWSVTNRGGILHVGSNGEALLNEAHGFLSGYASVAKLGSDGQLLWRLPLRRPAFAHSLDLAGNHILGSLTFGHWSDTVELVAINPSGEQLWRAEDLAYEQSFAAMPGLFTTPDGNLRLIAQPKGQAGTVIAALESQVVTGVPRFSLHPVNQVGATTKSAHFSARLDGNDASVRLQWYFAGDPLAGETNETLTLTLLNHNQSGDYYVEARNPVGAVFSRIASLRVVNPPYASQPVLALSLAVGSSIDLPIYLSATQPYSYQWHHNGAALASETNSVLRLLDVRQDAAGDYSVVVSNEAGAISHLVAQVRVLATVSEVWRSRHSISNGGDQACEQVVNQDGGVFLVNGPEVLKYSSEGALEWATNDSAFGLVPDGAGGVIYASHINITRLDAQGRILWQTNGNAPPLETWGNWIVTAGDGIRLQDLSGMSVGALTPDCEGCHWQSIRILQPDSSNSLVCAGLVGVDSFNHELGLAKLHREGQTQWFVRLGIPLPYWPLDQFAVSVDSESRVTVAVVVGVGAWPPAAYRLITVRLDAEGRELWRKVCDDLPSPGGAHLALDASGNAIAAGPGCIVKYDAHGHELWRTASGHPQMGVHLPKALAVDEAGAIYLAGDGSYYWQQMLLEKLSPDGNSLWASALDSAFSISALADLDLAEDGSVYVSFADYQTSSTFRFAESAVSGAPRILTNPEPSFVVLQCGAGFTANAAADGEGTLQYQWFFQAPFTPEAIALPGATNQTLALSLLCSPDSGQYFLEVRNEKGVAASRPVTLDVGYPPSFTVVDEDTSVLGNVARVNSGGSVRLHAFVHGNELPTRWQWFFNGQRIPGATNIFLEATNAVAGQAGIYALVGVNKYGANTNSMRLFVEDRVRTLFETGEAVGAIDQYENPDPLRPRLAVNRANEVYLLGTEFLETDGVTRWFVTKYSPGGGRLWRIQPPDSEGGSAGVAILLDADENILVAANDDGSQGEVGMRLLKLSPDGGLLWQTNYPDAPSLAHQASDMVGNHHGDLFLGGMGYDSEGFTNFLFVTKLSPNGHPLWEARAPHESGFGIWFDRPCFAPAEDGGIYAAGSLGLTRFSVSGARLWERAGAFHGVTLDPSGRIYVGRRWTGLASFAADGSPLWTSDQSGTAPLADGSSVFSLDLYRVFRHSPTGAHEWTSSPNGGTALALAPDGGCYVSRCLESRMQTRRLDADGSDTWFAVSAAPSDLRGHGSAVAVCPNGDIVSAHLLIRGRTITNPATAFYLLQRLRESTNVSVPTLRISPARAQARPGERVCFTAQFGGSPAEFQWFLGSYPMFGETNATLCSEATSWFWHDVWVQAVTDDGVFASTAVQLEIQLPYVHPPIALTNGLWRIPIWSKWSYVPLVLESSTNLLDWEQTSIWQNTYSQFFYFDFPQSMERQRYFRVRHIVPQQ